MKIFGFTLDDVLASAFTKLLWLAVVAWAVWYFARSKVTSAFWIGYAVASLVVLWVMTRVVNPIEGDKTYRNDFDGNGQAGTFNDYLQESVATSGGSTFKKMLDW